MDFGAMLNGFTTVLQPLMFAYLVIGFLVGTFFGAVPGLTALLAMCLLLPVTYGMDTVAALIMLMGIHMAGMYAGSITATTINIPGAPSAMMTQLEGYPMMKRGEGARALGHAAIASAIGGTLGGITTTFSILLVVKLVLLIQTTDKFMLLLMALVVVSIVVRGSIAKGIVMTVFGLMIASIGSDVIGIATRFHFGIPALVVGVLLIPLVIAVFAFSELMRQAENPLKIEVKPVKFRRRDFIPKWSEIKEIGLRRYLRSYVIGYFVGILPGAGGSVGAFISYAEALRSSEHPERYGKGSVEGIACAETANNAVCGGAIVPMLTFGIPGDACAAIVMGALLIKGLVPGPLLMQQQLDIIAPMPAALALCAALLIIPSLLILGPYYVKIVQINRAVLYSFIAMVAMVGTYVATYDVFQMFVVVVVGCIAYFLRKQGYPMVPLLLGYILGDTAEKFFIRPLWVTLNPLVFISRPAGIIFLVLTFMFLYFLAIRPWLSQRKQGGERPTLPQVGPPE